MASIFGFDLDQLDEQQGLPAGTMAAFIHQESRGDPNAIGPPTKYGRARGIMQMMPATAAQYGVDPMDPRQAIPAAAQMIGDLYRQYSGNMDKTIAGYNWGQGNVERKGMAQAPSETRQYIADVKPKLGRDFSSLLEEPVTPQESDGRDFSSLLAGTPAAPPNTGAGRDPDVPWPGEVPPEPIQKKRPVTMQELGAAIDQAPPSVFEGLTRGAFRDAMDFSEQLVSALIPDAVERGLSVEAKTTLEHIAAEDQKYEERRGAEAHTFDPARFVGAILSPTGMGAGIAGARAITKVPLIARGLEATGLPHFGAVGARGAAAGAAGSMAGPVGGARTPEELAAGKGMQAGLGVVAGPLAEAVGRGLTYGIGKYRGMRQMKNVRGPWSPPKGTPSGYANPEAEQLDRLARQHNVDLTAEQYPGASRPMQGTARLLENVPLIGIERETEQKQMQTAAQEYSTVLRDAAKAQSYQSLAKVQKVAAGGGKRAKEAQATLDLLERAGNDYKMITKASGNLTAFRMKLSSDELYEDFYKLAGKRELDVADTLDEIDKQLVEAQGAVDKDPGLINKLNAWYRSLDGMEVPEDAMYGGVDVHDLPMTDVRNTMSRLRDFKTVLQRMIASAGKGENSIIAEASVKYLNPVLESVEGTIEEFLNSDPVLKAASKRADDFYKNHLVPLKERGLASALRNQNPNVIQKQFINTQDEYAAQQLFRYLDPKGQAAARRGILDRAIKKATDPEGFDVLKFQKEVKKSAYATYFPGEHKVYIDGLLKLMHHAEASTPGKIASRTPMMWGGPSLGAAALGTASVGAAGTVVGAAGTVAGLGALSALFQTAAGKRLLLSANLLKPGSSQMANIFDKANQELARIAGRAAGAETSYSERPLP